MFFLREVCNTQKLWVIIIVSLRLKTHDDTFRHISVCKFHSSRHSQIDALSLYRCRRVCNEKWWKNISAQKHANLFNKQHIFHHRKTRRRRGFSNREEVEKNRKVIINASITSLFQLFYLSAAIWACPICPHHWASFFVIRKNKAQKREETFVIFISFMLNSAKNRLHAVKSSRD